MPKSTRSRPSESSEQTRAKLLAGARTVLHDHGYAAATARAIGEAAGCNQALVFYHYGSVHDLLLAALDDSSAQRLEQYRQTLGRVRTTRGLLSALSRLYEEDRRTGHVTILAQMVAGGLSDPTLGTAVAARVEPWVALTSTAIRGTLPAPLRRRVPVDEFAYAVVALSIGLEVLGGLSRDHTRVDATIKALTTGTALKSLFSGRSRTSAAEQKTYHDTTGRLRDPPTPGLGVPVLLASPEVE